MILSVYLLDNQEPVGDTGKLKFQSTQPTVWRHCRKLLERLK